MLLQNLQYAGRQLLRARTATVVTILTLALGIGANTSMFTLLNLTMYAAPPGVSQAGLVWLTAARDRGGAVSNMSYPDYLDIRDRAKDVQAMLAYTHARLSLGGPTPEFVRGEVVTNNYFDVLGVPAQRGSVLHGADDRMAGAEPVVVLSDAYWRRRFAASSGVLDSSIMINGRPFRVIGVAPPGFEGIEIGENEMQAFWLPMSMLPVAEPETSGALDDRESSGWLRVIGRLRPGASVTHFNVELTSLSAGIQRAHADPRDTIVFAAEPVAGRLDPSNRAEASRAMRLLMVVPLLVLVVACANAANVLLASGLARRKEFATRRALGASPRQLVAQLLVEAVALATAAAVVGVMFSFWMTWLIARLGTVPDGIAQALAPDRRVLMWTLALAAVTGLVFGLVPAIATTRASLISGLKDDGAGVVAGRERTRLRDTFIIAQTAVSLVFLVVAGLFVQSLSKALRSDPGFAARQGVVVQFDLARQGYDTARRRLFEHRLLDAVRATPGVRAAAIASTVPLGGRLEGGSVLAEGGEAAAGASVFQSSITPGYFAALDAPLEAGRDFAEHDDASGAAVVIVNATLAHRLWPGANAIGKRLRFGNAREPLREVVGVAKDGKYANLTERAHAFLYFPQAQQPAAHFALIVSSSANAATMLGAVRATVKSIDPNLPAYGEQTFEALVARAADIQRAIAAVLAVFGTLALILTAFGIFGITAHAVTRRTREIGIRVSLGARGPEVSRLFVREGFARAVIGIAFGLMASVALSRVLSAFLFGLNAMDAATFAGGAIVLCIIAVLSSYIPARRAAHIDPMAALRSE